MTRRASSLIPDPARPSVIGGRRDRRHRIAFLEALEKPHSSQQRTRHSCRRGSIPPWQNRISRQSWSHEYATAQRPSVGRDAQHHHGSRQVDRDTRTGPSTRAPPFPPRFRTSWHDIEERAESVAPVQAARPPPCGGIAQKEDRSRASRAQPGVQLSPPPVVRPVPLTGGRPPVANNDSYTVFHDRALIATTSTSGVLANDTDPDDYPLTAVLVTNVRHGALPQPEWYVCLYAGPRLLRPRQLHLRG